MDEKRKRSSGDDDDEYHVQKYQKTDNVIENPVVEETDDATDDDLDWLMDSVIHVNPAVAEAVEVHHLEEEVRYYNFESEEDLQFNNNLDDDEDYLNLTVIDNLEPPTTMPKNLFEHPVLDAVPQIPDQMPEMLSDQHLLIVLVLNAQMIGIASVDPDLDFMENEIIDDIISSIGTDTDFDYQLAFLTPEEDNLSTP